MAKGLNLQVAFCCMDSFLLFIFSFLTKFDAFSLKLMIHTSPPTGWLIKSSHCRLCRNLVPFSLSFSFSFVTKTKQKSSR